MLSVKGRGGQQPDGRAFTLIELPVVSRRERLAFTLIELLVVIAILSLLITILLPSIQKAKKLAKTLKCSTNLHAIARASALYASDNNGYVPRDYWWNNGPGEGNEAHYFFAAKLSPYISGPVIPFEHDGDDEYMYEVFKDVETLHCPSVTRKEFVVHYVVNGMDFERYTRDGTYTSSPASAVDKVPGALAEVLYVAEFNPMNGGLPVDSFGRYDIFKPSHMPFDSGGVMNGPGQSRMICAIDRRHDGRTTVVFFDGHAGPRTLTPSDVPVDLMNPQHGLYGE
jgi:prepilin-type N-terminal cleavage/methylation domain-containing protein/prepilin-type processing-associated H-X9-DG protein